MCFILYWLNHGHFHIRTLNIRNRNVVFRNGFFDLRDLGVEMLGGGGRLVAVEVTVDILRVCVLQPSQRQEPLVVRGYVRVALHHDNVSLVPGECPRQPLLGLVVITAVEEDGDVPGLSPPVSVVELSTDLCEISQCSEN